MTTDPIFFFIYFFYLVGPLSALDRGYPKFMLQYKSQDFVHTLRGVSALDSSPHILVTNGLGQSRSRRSPKPLSSLHTGTLGSWSPSQRSDQWRQVLDHLFLVHQALLKENCPMLLWIVQFHSSWHSSHSLGENSTIWDLPSGNFVFCIFGLLCFLSILALHRVDPFSPRSLTNLTHSLELSPPLFSRCKLFYIFPTFFALSSSPSILVFPSSTILLFQEPFSRNPSTPFQLYCGYFY